MSPTNKRVRVTPSPPILTVTATGVRGMLNIVNFTGSADLAPAAGAGPKKTKKNTSNPPYFGQKYQAIRKGWAGPFRPDQPVARRRPRLSVGPSPAPAKPAGKGNHPTACKSIAHSGKTPEVNFEVIQSWLGWDAPRPPKSVNTPLPRADDVSRNFDRVINAVALGSEPIEEGDGGRRVSEAEVRIWVEALKDGVHTL